MQTEISIDFDNLIEWKLFLQSRPDLLAPEAIDELGDQIMAAGCREPLTGAIIGPHEMDDGSSWREGLGHHGVGSRARAVLQVMADIINEGGLHSPCIYATEAITPFALRLRGLFPRFLGSEFTLDADQRNWLYPIPCEDLQKLSLRSGAFDIVTTNEVLEHVPSIDKALGEMCRVLRPGGWHVGTVPFHYFDEGSLRRARLDEQGKIVHLLEPEYHGDPLGEGILVFEIPGWDLMARARKAGFSRAFMRFMISSKHGVLSEHIGGVLVFCAQK